MSRAGRALALALALATPWLLALAGFALTIAAFSPGYLSWDSANQWWQARHGRYDSIHPPLMAMIWSAIGTATPERMLWLQCALYWGGFASVAAAWPARPWPRAAMVLLGFWPPLFGLLPQLWKDNWLLAGLLFATTALLRELQSPRAGWRLLAFAALCLAAAFRHNAIAAVLPLATWLAWRTVLARDAGSPLPPRRGRVLLGAVLFTAAVGVVAALPARLPSVRPVRDVWSVVALWDLTAVSLQANQPLFPPEVAAADLRLDELRPEFRDYAIGALLIDGPLQHSFDTDYTPAQRRALLQAWISLPLRHPRAYFRHRGRLTWLLLGFDAQDLPDHQVFQPVMTPFADNPPAAAPAGALHERLRSWLDAAVDTPLLAGWVYLLLTLAALVPAWRRCRAEPRAALAMALLASGLGYFLSLPLLSGSAEFRYLNWMILASLLGSLLLFRSGGAHRRD